MFGYGLRKTRQGAGQFKRRRRPNGPDMAEGQTIGAEDGRE